MNERVGFLVALKQGLDLRVFDRDLAAQKFIFFFEEANVPILGAANSGVRSRLFAAIRPLFALIFHSATVRDRSRPVATSRVCSYLVDVGNMALYRVGCDQVFFAGLGLDLVARAIAESW